MNFFKYGDVSTPNKFICIPQKLFTDYKKVSNDAKILYSFLLNRTGLSVKNETMTDDLGHVFIYCTQKEACEFVGCANQKIQKLFKELEDNFLISRIRQGLTKADKIYVANICEEEKLSTESTTKPVDNFAEIAESSFLNDENHHSGQMKIINNKYYNNKDLHNDNKDKSVCHKNNIVAMPTKEQTTTRLSVKRKIGYDFLIENYDKNLVNMMFDIIVSGIESKKDRYVNGILVSFTDYADRLSIIDTTHVEFVIERYTNTVQTGNVKIQNLRGYLSTCLYNSPVEIDEYYSQLVRADEKLMATKSYSEDLSWAVW